MIPVFVNYARLLHYATMQKLEFVPSDRTALFAIGSCTELLDLDRSYMAPIVILYAVNQRRWIIFTTPYDRSLAEADAAEISMDQMTPITEARRAYDAHKVQMRLVHGGALAKALNALPGPAEEQKHVKWMVEDGPALWFRAPTSKDALSEWIRRTAGGSMSSVARQYFQLSQDGIVIPPIAIKKTLRALKRC